MKRRFAVALQLALLMCFSERALSAVLFGESVDPGQASPLFSINQSAGNIAEIGPTGFSNVADLTSDPATGRLWGVEAQSNQPGRLLSINSNTGAAAVVATLDSAKPIVSLAFDPITRKLYGSTAVGFGASQDALYTIDPLSGHTSLVGVIGFDNVYALGFDQQGKLFGVSEISKALISINTTTGAGTQIDGFKNNDINRAFDLASRPGDNTMFLADSGSMSLYTLNTVTGHVDLIGPYGSSANIVGLAFLTSVPEPSTYLVLCVGLSLFALLRQRRAH